MKSVGIIGLGTITKHYLKGFEESTTLKLTAVCDVNENAVSRNIFSAYPFYSDYKEMLNGESLDCIVVSTPPATHFEIVSYALQNGVDVIVEKPITLNMDDYDALRSLADKNSRNLEVMFHWQNGSEVIAFNEHYDPSKISEIRVSVVDPYSEDGVTIDKSKQKLMGTWIDSGVNILSMIKMWLPFDSLSVEKADVIKCPETEQPIFIDAHLLIDSIKTHITIDWRLHRNHKESFVIYDGRKIQINHSRQCIVDGDEVINCEHMERLQQHYYQYFKNYSEKTDTDSAVRIHRFLFEVNSEL